MKNVYLAAYGTPTPPTPPTPNIQPQPVAVSVAPALPLKELQKSICISIVNLIEIINMNQERLYTNDNNVRLVHDRYLKVGEVHCKETSRRGHFDHVVNMFKAIFMDGTV